MSKETTLTALMHRVEAQSESKKLWVDNDSPDVVANMIVEEGKELQKAIYDDEEAFEVASEIGDVLYLTLKLCAHLGIQPEDAVEMKLLRNDMKYPTDLNSTGDYETARQRSKEMWKAMGGDIAFSYAYLEAFSTLPESGEVKVENDIGLIYTTPEDYTI